MNKLTASVTNTTNLLNIQLVDSHVGQVANATIEAVNTSLNIGDSIDVTIGYVGNSDRLFSGYVKSIEHKEPANTYVISASNVLVRAMDYFIAAADQNNPFTRSNIKAEDLVVDVLSLSGLTSFSVEESYFTFAIHNPVEVNITSSYDYAHFISSLLAFSLYGDKDGIVHFVNRRPYVMPGDSSIGTLNNNNIIDISYSLSEKDLRNRVVVYGSGDIHAEAQASSPYLPAGFYKSVLVAAPEVIDTQAMAQKSCDYNLELYNRPNKSVNCTVIGDPNLEVRKVITVDKPLLGATGDWYIYGITHDWSSTGYLTSMELRQ